MDKGTINLPVSAVANRWNNLPVDISNDDNFNELKSLLNMHLFKVAFNM